MKLSHTVTFKILATVLLAYGALTLWHVFTYKTAWFLVWSLPCIAGAIGLLMSRSWAQYVYYVIAFFTAAGWAGFVSVMWPSLTEQAATRLFGLGAVMIPFCAISSFLLFRSFRIHAAQVQ